MNDKFKKLLSNIDLTPTQIQIYLSVLKNGNSTVLDISKETKINRSQIYFDTNILVERGVLELTSNRLRKFIAVRPSKLAQIIKDKKSGLDELDQILPELDEFYQTDIIKKKEDFTVRVFEGVNQLRKAYNLELELAKGMQILSVVGNISFQYKYLSPEYWEKWNKRFILSGGTCKMIIDTDDSYFSKLSENFTNDSAIVLKGIKGFDLKCNFDVFDEYVLIATFDKVPKAVIIHNKLLAYSYVEVFKRLWAQ